MNEDSEAYEEEDFDNAPNGVVDEVLQEAEEMAVIAQAAKNEQYAMRIAAGDIDISSDGEALIEDDYNLDESNNVINNFGAKRQSDSMPSHQPSQSSQKSAKLKKQLRQGSSANSRKSFKRTQESEMSKQSRGLKRDDLQIDIEVAEEQAVFPEMNQEQ